MKRIYVDLDGVMCDFKGQYNNLKTDFVPNPQTTYGFYTSLPEIPGAIETYKWLEERFDVWILTRPSIKNTNCYTEKAEWIKKYFGEDFLEKLILCPDKSLVKGDYLIDDDHRHGQTEFEGEHIHFGKNENFQTWSQVVEYLMSK